LDATGIDCDSRGNTKVWITLATVTCTVTEPRAPATGKLLKARDHCTIGGQGLKTAQSIIDSGSTADSAQVTPRFRSCPVIVHCSTQPLHVVVQGGSGQCRFQYCVVLQISYFVGSILKIGGCIGKIVAKTLLNCCPVQLLDKRRRCCLG
jgi:hypothetical protein